MRRPKDLASLIDVRVIDGLTKRHGRIRNVRASIGSSGPYAEAVVCFDGLPEPLGTISDYYNLKQLDRERPPRVPPGTVKKGLGFPGR